MDEPPPLEDGSSYGVTDFHKKKKEKEQAAGKNAEAGENLEEKFYKYGVRPEWLQVNRIINHRYGFVMFITLVFEDNDLSIK